MMARLEKLFAAMAMVALMVAAAPCDASAQAYEDSDDPWTMSPYLELGPRIGGAPGAPAGIDSRAGMEIGLGADWVGGAGWGFGLNLVSGFGVQGDPSPALFHFTVEPSFVKRLPFLTTEVLTIGLGPSFGVSQGSFDSRCPDNCTPEMQAEGVTYNAHDSFVVGGTLTLAVDHVIGGYDTGAVVGIALRGRGLWAVADEVSPARWSGAILLRVGARFSFSH
ncbi:MAG: hypothetical protein JRH11_09910 [Deltaproteobacteria bacterium]|nr:hypothetical protein [Deltaproteobacteria bacterium]